MTLSKAESTLAVIVFLAVPTLYSQMESCIPKADPTLTIQAHLPSGIDRAQVNRLCQGGYIPIAKGFEISIGKFASAKVDPKVTATLDALTVQKIVWLLVEVQAVPLVRGLDGAEFVGKVADLVGFAFNGFSGTEPL